LFAVSRRRNAEFALERPVERGFGFVTDLGCDLLERLVARLEQARSKLEPPSRQVCERGLAEKTRETVRQDRARCAGCRRETRQRPILERFLVHERERGADDWVSGAREPAVMLGRKLLH